MTNILQSQIIATYFQLTNNESNVRVKLADIKAAFKGIDIDAALLALHRDPASTATMYGLDNPAEITKADEEAAVAILPAYPMHIIYIER